MRPILLFLLLLSLPAGAQLLDETDLERAAALREAALSSPLAWALLESLTTEVGPRMAGSPGDARAVAWARDKFKALGFDRVSTEPVEFPRWERGAAQARVIAPYPQPLVITALGGSIGTDGLLQGSLLRFATLEALEAAPAAEVAGHIIYIGNRMRRAADGSGYGPAVAARTRGASIAAAKGARALLIRSIGTSDDRVAHTGLLRYEDDGQRIPAAALSNPDADQLDRMLARDEEVVVELSIDAGLNGVATSFNVIGDILGSERPDEMVVIGCHLDSWDLGTGAIDDGAGCAITMAAAHLIGQQEPLPARTIRVILFANEEQGLWGGRAYADAHQQDLAAHVIGAESDFGAGRVYRFSTRITPQAFAAADQISRVLAPLGIVRGDNAAGGGPDLSALRRAGMPVATLHQDGSDYFDYHHSPNDTLDKVDPEALAQNVAAYTVFAYLAAQYPGRF